MSRSHFNSTTFFGQTFWNLNLTELVGTSFKIRRFANSLLLIPNQIRMKSIGNIVEIWRIFTSNLEFRTVFVAIWRENWRFFHPKIYKILESFFSSYCSKIRFHLAIFFVKLRMSTALLLNSRFLSWPACDFIGYAKCWRIRTTQRRTV